MGRSGDRVPDHDRPTPANADLAPAAGSAFASAPPGQAPPGFGAGIRRGVMAADHFTQIANGLFGLISTHRDGWPMNVTDLARRSRDGEATVKNGLKELEKHGFLPRECERHPDGTLAAAAYFITDLPSLQNSRAQPMPGFPALLSLP